MKPKILFFDIETSPNIGYTWEKYQQDVISFQKDWELLSFAWKWQGGSAVKCIGRDKYKDPTDESLCADLYNLMKQADIIVAHNGDEFDIKKAKARFLVHGFPPLPACASVDTKKVAKRYFKFTSNKLDDLGRQLGVGRKLKHQGFDMWLGCLAGDKKAWKTMKHYNKQDVLLLERVYDRMRPYIQHHPSLAILNERVGCPMCGSEHVKKDGVRGNNRGLQQQMKCLDCKGYYLVPFKKERK